MQIRGHLDTSTRRSLDPVSPVSFSFEEPVEVHCRPFIFFRLFFFPSLSLPQLNLRPMRTNCLLRWHRKPQTATSIAKGGLIRKSRRRECAGRSTHYIFTRNCPDEQHKGVTYLSFWEVCLPPAQYKIFPELGKFYEGVKVREA